MFVGRPNEKVSVFCTTALSANISPLAKHSYEPSVFSPRLIEDMGAPDKVLDRVQRGRSCSRMPTYTFASLPTDKRAVASTLFSTSTDTKG